VRPSEPVNAVVGPAGHIGIFLSYPRHVLVPELLLHLVFRLIRRVTDYGICAGPFAEQGVIAENVSMQILKRQWLLKIKLKVHLALSCIYRGARLVDCELLTNRESKLCQLNCERYHVDSMELSQRYHAAALHLFPAGRKLVVNPSKQ